MALVRLRHLGRMRYLPALTEQINEVQKVKEGAGHALLLVEHEPVYTTGIRTRDYTSDEEARLKSLGADFVRTNRGGLITFHGPGQLLAYPILDLKALAPGVQSASSGRKKQLLGMKWYVHTLEQTVIDACAELGLPHAARSPHTGVWLGDDKICAMGVASSDLVTSHGLALNCNTDMKWYGHIVPCGILDKGVTSLTRALDREVKVKEVEKVLIQQFEKNFECEVKEDNEEQ